MMSDSWKDNIGDTIEVVVTPNATANRIKVESKEDGSFCLRIYVTVVPEDGKANDAVIKLLAKELGVAKSSLQIIRGKKSRKKTFRITK